MQRNIDVGANVKQLPLNSVMPFKITVQCFSTDCVLRRHHRFLYAEQVQECIHACKTKVGKTIGNTFTFNYLLTINLTRDLCAYSNLFLPNLSSVASPISTPEFNLLKLSKELFSNLLLLNSLDPKRNPCTPTW